MLLLFSSVIACDEGATDDVLTFVVKGTTREVEIYQSCNSLVNFRSKLY